MTATKTERLVDPIEIDALCRAASSRGLCEFAAAIGCTRRTTEAEHMVLETLAAARINAKAGNGPFSFKGPNVHAFSGGGLVDNATAYGFLVDNGYFEEDKVSPHLLAAKPNRLEPDDDGYFTVIYATAKLGDALKKFLGV